MEYFDYTKTKSCKMGINYQFIIGQRSNGKSYSVGQYVANACINSDSQFIFLVGNAFEGEKKTSYFAESCSEIVLKGNKYYFDNKLIGFHMCLSLDDDYKSNQYPKVKYIIREEFIKQDFTDYIDNEIQHFQSILSTVFRHRSGTVFLIGNTLDTIYNNPYFEYFGLDINKLNLKQGDEKIIYSVNDSSHASISIIYCENMYKDEKDIPIMQKIPNNTVAISGSLIKPTYLIGVEDFVMLINGSRNDRIHCKKVGVFYLYIGKYDILVSTKVKNIHQNQTNIVQDIYNEYLNYTFYFDGFNSYDFFYSVLGYRLTINKKDLTKELECVKIKLNQINQNKKLQKVTKDYRTQKKRLVEKIKQHEKEKEYIKFGYYGDSLALQEYLLSTHNKAIKELKQTLHSLELQYKEDTTHE